MNLAEGFAGAQIGAVNAIISGESYGRAKSFGVHLGLLNLVDHHIGLQAGLICYAREGTYFQIGLLNIHGTTGPWYTRISPVLGFHREPKAERAGAAYGPLA